MMIFTSLIISLILSVSCYSLYASSDQEQNPNNAMQSQMPSFQGQRHIQFQNKAPNIRNVELTPPAYIDENRYRDVLRSVKIEHLNSAYNALCKQFETHPQKETLRVIAHTTFSDRAKKELPWINQKMMAFEILGNYAMTTQKHDQAKSFAASLDYWQTIKIGLAKWMDPSIFNKTDLDTYNELTNIANQYAYYLEGAEIMMDDCLLNKNNPYAVPSLLGSIPVHIIKEIQEALAREND